MLVLSRKEGESLIIGDQISITVLSVDSNGQVNLGICAPKEVLVLRSELQKAATENQDAASTAPALLVAELESALSECTQSQPTPPAAQTPES
ncbi:carbon storage regulator [Pseudoflavonifractor capillosus]|uniref:carbon storage regulator n=1 Tax=Pseudoflavonifractor capillosus TaxID=106588 RepID=UPI0023F76020|nr:carbon storage regulator [Pseudoflavonifractor capillosus]MDY4660318.1 carbon storage regulator [Pseudoflavonifractor capillosus]